MKKAIIRLSALALTLALAGGLSLAIGKKAPQAAVRAEGRKADGAGGQKLAKEENQRVTVKESQPEAEMQTESEGQTESGSQGETESQTEAESQTETESQTKAESKTESESKTEAEEDDAAAAAEDSGGTGNGEITYSPSNANALVLMDDGAQSPRGVPGQTVTIVLPIAVNREYLPSEKYMLRNITIQPSIGGSSSGTSSGSAGSAVSSIWPFDAINASYVKHLDDMTYNSTVVVYYDFRVSEFATKGVYSIPFTVNATVWREDPVNGTAIDEDVTFTLTVYMTVVDDGSLSGVTSGIGPITLDGVGEDGVVIQSPVASPGQTVNMRLPLVNKGGTLTNITVAPVIDASLDSFPFIAENMNYGRNIDYMDTNGTAVLDYQFKVSPYATTGNKVVKFHATYRENGVIGECDFNAYIYIRDGYEEGVSTPPSLMISEYAMYVEGKKVEFLNAGDEARLVLTLKNNSVVDTAIRNVVTVTSMDTSVMYLTADTVDTAYVKSLGPEKTEEVEYFVTVRGSAPVGVSPVGLTLTFETGEGLQGSYTQNLMIPVKQPMKLSIDEPTIYGTPVEGQPLSVGLNVVNLGRTKVYNTMITAKDGIAMEETYYGGDLLAGGASQPDFEVIVLKSGDFTGTLVFSYEDEDGEAYAEYISLPLSVAEQEEPETGEAGKAETAAESQGKGSGPGVPLAAGAVAAAAAVGLGCCGVVLNKKGILTGKNLRRFVGRGGGQ